MPLQRRTELLQNIGPVAEGAVLVLIAMELSGLEGTISSIVNYTLTTPQP